MRPDEKKLPKVFESSDLTGLVGVKPIYLNKFVERGLYGIEPSVRTGKGRGRRRLFSEEDVFGVALVWWLFESGLRSQAIQYVLNQICGHKEASAGEAARKLFERQAQLLVIKRKPRSGKEQKAKQPKQSIEVVDELDAAGLLSRPLTENIHIIPVRNLFSNLTGAMETFGLSEQGD